MSTSAFLPLLTYPEATPSAGFARALDLAATLGAEIHATIVEADIRPPSDPLLNLTLMAADIAAEAEAASRRAGAELGQNLTLLAHRVGVPLSIDTTRARLGWAGEKMGAAARVHDWSFLCTGDDQDHRDLAESVLFTSGGPAILFPNDGPTHVTTVGVAWDNSRAAARALRDALPVLALARRVVVFSATFDKDIGDGSVAAVLALLARHGITATAETITTSDAPTVADALQDAALARDCGLLVMGAYGHSRLRELILGGATRSVLGTRRLAVLMSH